MASGRKLRRRMMCLWPGLPDLWEGRVRGLIPALLFAGLLQTVIFVCQIWPDLLSASGRLVVCFGVVLFWLTWSVPQVLRVAGESHVNSTPAATEHLFKAAQREYLLGNLFQAEKLLEQLLELKPEDAEAKLYLATTYRRAGRESEALAALNELQSAPAGRRWRWEIGRERRMIQPAPAQPTEPRQVPTRGTASDAA